MPEVRWVDGKDCNAIIAELNSQLMLLGLEGDLTEYVQDVIQNCVDEHAAIELARWINSNGASADDVLQSIQKFLYVEHELPADRAEQDIFIKR